MNIGKFQFSNIAGAMSRTIRGVHTTQDLADTDFDPYVREPVMRSDIELMLAQEVEAEAVTPIAEEVEKLRASEQVEHNRMCEIRGALYAGD